MEYWVLEYYQAESGEWRNYTVNSNGSFDYCIDALMARKRHEALYIRDKHLVPWRMRNLHDDTVIPGEIFA